jgi:hypothetical protein
MIPDNVEIIEQHYETKWLLTGVAGEIDLKRMSTAGRRDFPVGVSGSHMALDEDTCRLEVAFEQPPKNSYVLSFTGCLRMADLRSAGDAQFSGQFYDANHDFSQYVFLENQPEYEKEGCDGIHRYSFVAMQKVNEKRDVVAIFPEAFSKLKLVNVQPLGTESPPISIRMPDGSMIQSDQLFPQ